MQTVPRAATVI